MNKKKSIQISPEKQFLNAHEYQTKGSTGKDTIF